MGFGLRDDDDAMIQLLAQIAQNTGGVDSVTNQTTNNIEYGDTTNNRTNNVEYETGGSEGSSAYFSTGKAGLSVPGSKTGDSWEKLSLGISASTVNIRAPVGINIAFANPSVNSGRSIPLTAEELPFTIGGDTPINTDTIWVQLRKEQDKEATIHVIAFK